MLDFIRPITLIRYLIVWRVTSPVVLIPRCLPNEIMAVLGKLIEENLPTPQNRAWRKALASPTMRWPIEVVLFTPCLLNKRAYGKDEMVVWELKLIGGAADHGLFLEVILPAMEKAATTREISVRGARNLWGHFDIQAVYAARGRNWEAFVEEGKLNMGYRVTPTQWAEGLVFDKTIANLCSLTWVTPFEFPVAGPGDSSAMDVAPTLRNIFDALMRRMTLFLPGRPDAQRVTDVWAQLSPEKLEKIELILQQETNRSLIVRDKLQPPPKEWPGQKVGTQVFQSIDPALLPYLELASILHVGEHTRLGCGTFVLA
ncbi:CRISPR_Cas6 domain-containing protein [Gammaproteobacteria bacterium]